MLRPSNYVKSFFDKVQKLIDEENVKSTWNEGANISNVVIKAAVYYLLSNGQASICDIRNACDKAIKSYEEEYP